MNNKNKGIVCLFFGSYLLIINPIVSILFFFLAMTVPLSPMEFWWQWYLSGGIPVIFLIGLGLLLIVIGSRYLKSQ